MFRLTRSAAGRYKFSLPESVGNAGCLDRIVEQMKRQVLFVDDEPMILEGLKRTLRGLRDEWDMYFVGSAEKALSLMEERQVSVVVSDMRMPGLNGAQLMNLLMERHPGTVRLILSGYADRDLILSCVQSAHQCLPKPCDPETLLTAINRAAELEESRKNQNLQSLISQLQTVPSLPPPLWRDRGQNE